jgi:hypothetical protein
MVDERLKYDEPPVRARALPYSWRGWVVFSMVFCCVFCATSLVLTWWSGQAIRPLALAGGMAWVLALVGLACRRRLMRENAPNDTRYRWYRFSLAEMFVIATGLALNMGLMGADYQQRLSTQRERDRLRTATTEVLGPEGQLGFEYDGTMTISVCDRTFDDQRFAELAGLIHDYVESNGVSRVMFGTGSRTIGTPPRWPGVTDASVDILLGWQKMHMLHIQGTGISPAGQERLLTLQKLDELSQANLDAKSPGKMGP